MSVELRLYKAAERGDLKEVEEILSSPSRLDLNDAWRQWTPLMRACQHNYLEIVKLLLDAGANINYIGPQKSTALIKAVHYCNFDIASFLISKGASVNNQDTSGNTALIFAIQVHRDDLVDLLLDAGAKIPSPSVIKKQLEHTDHLKYNNRKIVKSLNARGSNVRLEKDEYLYDYKKNPKITDLACKGKVNEIASLLETDPSQLDARTSCTGETPLITACRFNNIEVVKLLIKKKADLDFMSSRYTTALMLATKFGYLRVVKALVNAKASLTLLCNGKSVLTYACIGRYTQIVKFYLDKGLRPVETPEKLLEAMSKCAKNSTEFPGIIEMLSSVGFDIYGVQKLTPEQKRIKFLEENVNNLQKTVKTLLEENKKPPSEDLPIKESDPEQNIQEEINQKEEGIKLLKEKLKKSKKNIDALFLASEKGNLNSIKKLVSGGVNVNCKSPVQETTPLHSAAKNGKFKAVKLLITLGALIEAQDSRKETPLAAAIFESHVKNTVKGYKETVKILLNSKAKFSFTILERLIVRASEEFPSGDLKETLTNLGLTVEGKFIK